MQPAANRGLDVVHPGDDHCAISARTVRRWLQGPATPRVSGSRYTAVANSPFGSVPIVRLENRVARVRDKLNRAIWHSHSRLSEARQRFRQTLIDRVPGAERRGVADRVSVPVTAIADRQETVVRAIVELARELVAK